jgi:hypothetical protein
MAKAGLSDRVDGGWQSLRRARYSAAMPRYLVCAAVALFCLLGLRATFFSAPPAPAASPVREAAGAPSEDFALQFARAYLSYDSKHPGLRERALAPFTGGNLAAGAGFEPSEGDQFVNWAEVASDQRALAGGRIITVAAAISTQRLPVYLAVTVRHEPGEPLELGGYPSFIGAPAIASASAEGNFEAVSDPKVSVVVDRVLRNYLSGAAPDLRADLVDEAQVTLPTQRLRLEEVQRVGWIGKAGSGAVLATLVASDSRGATYTLSYELGITYRERPYVDFIEVVPTDS